MGAPPLSEPSAFDAVEMALARGDGAAAREALDRLLAERAAGGDAVAGLTLRVLAGERFAPDAMAAVVDRLVGLVRAQEGQIRALQAMVAP